MDATYVMPIRRASPERSPELITYLHHLAKDVQVVVVDGSPPDVFAAHREAWPDAIEHVPVSPDLATPNGKVGGVLTGVLLHARHERIVIADDDVRYDRDTLARLVAMLDDADVVRPQNHFDPAPWHAQWDTARTLLNRMTGGDWPGTLAVRRSMLQATGGYAGDVMFENLELVRTVRAAGGVEAVPLDLYVPRRPPTARHFRSQRVRQAYDELARPARLAASLSVVPAAAALASRRRWGALAAATLGVMALAEAGRRRAGGARVFPAAASLWAPLWVLERGACSWVALATHVRRGGIPYWGEVLPKAATPMRVLRERHAEARAQQQTRRKARQQTQRRQDERSTVVPDALGAADAA